MKVELLYTTTCNGSEIARQNLGEVFKTLQWGTKWQEFDLNANDLPHDYKHYGSPTILIDGQDIYPDQIQSGGT